MKHVSFKKMLSKLVVTAAVVAMATISASACTTIYVGGNLIEEGTPFVARTEDYGSDMNKLWKISEAGQFKKGETYLGCPEYGEFEWTWTHDSYRFTHFTNDVFFNGTCPECGQGTAENPCTHLSYTEFGTNEKGLSVSATETIYGNEKVKAADPLRQKKVDHKVGIEETDIPTILLAEAGSAREGIELLTKIYDEYGAYFESGVFICDQNETWYIENCSGTQYVAIKLNDDMIFLEPNLAVIGRVDLNDKENVIASPRLIEVAEKAGTFVGDKEKNIIDFRASYAPLSGVGAPRMVDGLNFLDKNLNCTKEDLLKNNTMFTISNVDKDGKTVPLYTNIKADRKLTKKDVFDYYKLSSIGSPSNQEIEIFQLFKDRPVETATVGWVGVGNMSNNVFIPYYPMLMTDMYEGYQVSLDTAKRVDEKPDGFCSWRNGWYGDGKFVQYPENWRDSYYFSFEGLGGYIRYADKIDGMPVSAEDKQLVLDKMNALQDEFIKEFEAMKPEDTTVKGKDMAKRAHMLALEMIDYVKGKVPPTQHTITLEVEGRGTASANVTEAIRGDKVTLTASYPSTWEFVEWQSKDVTVDKDGTFIMPDKNVKITAVFNYVGSSSGKPVTPDNKPVKPVEPTKPVEPAKPSFNDVAANDWYFDAVQWGASKNVVSGVAQGVFAPELYCTRAQAVTFLWNLAGQPVVSGVNPFTDVAPNAWYAEAVKWAVSKNITAGTSATTFSPDLVVDRAQVVTFLYNYAGQPAVSGKNPFADVDSNAWYAKAVQWAVSKNITAGTTPTTFAPAVPCDRAQMVTFLYNYCGK